MTAQTKMARPMLAKAMIGAVAAGAMAVSAAAPAQARDNGIGAGEVIAGALIIGGIAAIAASSGSKSNDYSYARAGYRNDGRYGYDRWSGNPRQAVSQCVTAAERTASRRSWRGNADVTDIRSVKENRDGYTVKGRIAVNTMGRDWRSGDGNYGRGWNRDYRGWNQNMRGYDSGSFECRVRKGRITKLNFSGIRGL